MVKKTANCVISHSNKSNVQSSNVNTTIILYCDEEYITLCTLMYGGLLIENILFEITRKKNVYLKKLFKTTKHFYAYAYFRFLLFL